MDICIKITNVKKEVVLVTNLKKVTVILKVMTVILKVTTVILKVTILTTTLCGRTPTPKDNQKRFQSHS